MHCTEVFVCIDNRANAFCFLSSLPLLSPERFRGIQKEDGRGPLIIQYSLEYSMQRNRLGNKYVFFVIFSPLKIITEDFR
jgi:hypothetical protein